MKIDGLRDEARLFGDSSSNVTNVMKTLPSRSRWTLAGGVLLVLVAGAGAWAWDAGHPSLVSTTTTLRTPAKSFRAPQSSAAADAQFLTDVPVVDPALTSYEKDSGNVALRSLLTDGSAFCAFLNQDRDIDGAMVSVVIGARHVESQTHLPLSVRTFNAVDSVALLTLCPSLEPVVPASDLAKIRQLGAALSIPAH